MFWVKPNWLYGLTMITWSFGAWKTFWLGAELYELKKEKWDNVCIIANVPWAITDVYYNSLDDYALLVDHLYKFFEDTNSMVNEYDRYFKDIVIVMDETQIYFPARWFADKKIKAIWDKLTILITQCRKRNMKMWCATQRTKMVDINFRRLADYIWFYRQCDILFVRVNRLNIFQCGWAVSDLLWEDWVSWATKEDLKESEVYSWLWHHRTDILDSLLKITNPDWMLWKEKSLTKHISWLIWSFYNLSYEDLVSKIISDNVRLSEKAPVWSLIYKNEFKIPVFTLCSDKRKDIDLHWKDIILNEYIKNYIK